MKANYLALINILEVKFPGIKIPGKWNDTLNSKNAPCGMFFFIFYMVFILFY